MELESAAKGRRTAQKLTAQNRFEQLITTFLEGSVHLEHNEK